jgi:hypothetical protein
VLVAASSPDEVAVDSTNLYFTSTSSQELRKAPLAGGIAIVLKADLARNSPLALDARSVYVSTLHGLTRVAKHDGTALLLTSVQPGSISLGAGTIYFSWAGNRILSMSSGGGGVKSVAVGASIQSLVAGQRGLYWTDAGILGGELPGAGWLSSLSFAKPGQPTTLVSGETRPSAVVADQSAIYWIDAAAAYPGTAQGALKRLSLSGGPGVQLATVSTAVARLAADDTNVYWTDSGRQGLGYVYTIPKSGKTGPILLWSGPGAPTGIAADCHNVYWTNRLPEGSIMRLPKAPAPHGAE